MVVELPPREPVCSVVCGNVPGVTHQQQPVPAGAGQVAQFAQVGPQGARRTRVGGEVGEPGVGRAQWHPLPRRLKIGESRGGERDLTRFESASETAVPGVVRVIVAEQFGRAAVEPDVVEPVVHHDQVESLVFEMSVLQQAVTRGETGHGEVVNPDSPGQFGFQALGQSLGNIAPRRLKNRAPQQQEIKLPVVAVGLAFGEATEPNLRKIMVPDGRGPIKRDPRRQSPVRLLCEPQEGPQEDDVSRCED